MRKSRVRSHSIITIAIVILGVMILVVGARPREYQAPKVSDDTSLGNPPVSKMKQRGSPLTIDQVTVENVEDPLMPTIHCRVRNDSNRQILIYAVKHEAVFSQRSGAVSGSVTFHPADAEHAMLPGETREVEIYGVKYGEMPQSVTLSVDFVEFIDGGRWGPDSLKNGEVIDGTRAGARAEKDALLRVLRTEGTEGVMRSLDSIQPVPDQTPAQSPEWVDGFRGGVGWIRERVRSKGQNQGEIEKELKSPVYLNQERR